MFGWGAPAQPNIAVISEPACRGRGLWHDAAMDAQRPDPAALNHLKVELSWLRTLLNAHLRRMQAQGLLPAPDARFPGTSVAPTEIEARLRQAMTPKQFAGVLEETSRAELASLTAARDALSVETPSLPLARMRTAFQLSDDEYLVLLLSIAGEFEPTMSRLFAYLQNHFERQYPTLGLVADCLVEPGASAEVRWILDAEATLRSNALVRLDEKKETVPVIHRAILSDPRIVRFVQGFPQLDEKLATVATLVHHSRALRDPVLPPGDRPAWDKLMAEVDGQAATPWNLQVLVFRGPPGVGKHTWAAAAAAQMGLSHFRVDLPALVAEYGGLEWGLRVALREARLQQAMLCLDGWALLTEPRRMTTDDPGAGASDDTTRKEATRTLQRVMGGYPGTWAMTIEDPLGLPPQIDRRIGEVVLSMPVLQTGIELWNRYLPKRMRVPKLTSKKLASSFRLTPGQVMDAVRDAAGDAAPGQLQTYESLGKAVKHRVRHRLGENASLIELDYKWEDLVVSEDVGLQLDELIGRWNQRTKVYETWGLGRRFGTGQGLSVLFEGPPGTGKTMAASIVAGALDLDLYSIDLSKVVSRYVGETEKNLGQIFDEAERARAMLLFDEADSLFSSRTAVKSANDRYANLEVNYLLQRVEHFTGIAVLTTNFPTGIDEAFRRRIAMRLTFPKPEVPERTKLWQSMLNNKQIMAPGIDFEDLAYEFELAGGHIKNAVLRAAFIAAGRNCRIDQDLLRIAARIELKEQGLLIHGSPYDELRAHEG